MATQQDVGRAISTGQPPKPAAHQGGIESFLNAPNIRKRFEEMLGKKAAGFMSSIISAWTTNSALRTCDPKTVVAAGAMAATLDLPINGNLGFAAIVPYKGKAQFQIMAKGFIQLGIRSGQYRKMNCSEVYADELEYYNPITGEFKFTDPKTWKIRYEGNVDKAVGYVSFFELLNGFEKWLYMTRSQSIAHGKRYSQSFNSPNGKWQQDPHAMSLKTVIKLLLSKWGILSVDMQRAITVDQAVVNDEGEVVEFPDAINADTVEGEESAPVNGDKPSTAAPVAKVEAGPDPDPAAVDDKPALDRTGKKIEL